MTLVLLLGGAIVLLPRAIVLLPRKGAALMSTKGLHVRLPIPLRVLLLLGLLQTMRSVAPGVWGVLPETLLPLVVRAGV